jgi:LAGLIDADG-like domain
MRDKPSENKNKKFRKKRGTKPAVKFPTKWSSEFAYAVGLIATDGNLSSRHGHFDFTSKDREQVANLKKCLELGNDICKKYSGAGNMSYRIQFGGTPLYEFMCSIGITPRKSKTIGHLDIPEKYFFDFLRGHFDGDGTFYSYFDKRWKSSFMFYVELTSAGRLHLEWLQGRLRREIGIEGRITKSINNSAYRLKFAKAESLQLLASIYYDESVICLSRKRRKIERALSVIGRKL